MFILSMKIIRNHFIITVSERFNLSIINMGVFHIGLVIVDSSKVQKKSTIHNGTTYALYGRIVMSGETKLLLSYGLH